MFRQLLNKSVMLLIAVVCVAGCGKEEEPVVESTDYQVLALEFTETLARRDYDAAYAMTSERLREQMTRDDMQKLFERMVPLDWEFGDIVVEPVTLEEWPTKKPDDVGWAYVTIGGDGYSEAVAAVISSEEGQLKISEVEFGRP